MLAPVLDFNACDAGPAGRFTVRDLGVLVSAAATRFDASGLDCEAASQAVREVVGDRARRERGVGGGRGARGGVRTAPCRGRHRRGNVGRETDGDDHGQGPRDDQARAAIAPRERTRKAATSGTLSPEKASAVSDAADVNPTPRNACWPARRRTRWGWCARRARRPRPRSKTSTRSSVRSRPPVGAALDRRGGRCAPARSGHQTRDGNHRSGAQAADRRTLPHRVSQRRTRTARGLHVRRAGHDGRPLSRRGRRGRLARDAADSKGVGDAADVEATPGSPAPPMRPTKRKRRDPIRHLTIVRLDLSRWCAGTPRRARRVRSRGSGRSRWPLPRHVGRVGAEARAHQRGSTSAT